MRILLADHYEQPRLALGMLLREHPGFDLIGEAVDAQELLLLAEERSPDLVLLEAELPGHPIMDLLSALRALAPRPIICVMSSDFARARSLLNAGADTFVSKVDDPGWLVVRLQDYASQVRKEGVNRNK